MHRQLSALRQRCLHATVGAASLRRGVASSTASALQSSSSSSSSALLASSPLLPRAVGRGWRCRGRLVWATLAGLCAGVGLCTVAGAAVVLCRPYDTPPYLIPYYLRDVRSRFLHYASVRKGKGGPLYMTAEDFVLALLAAPEKVLRNPAIVADLRRLFESMDANGDGVISFPEFRFLMSLLTSDPREVAALFRIVDTDRSGTLTLEEFANVLRGVTKEEAVVRSLLKPSTRRNGIVRALFGDEAAPRRCTFAELEEMIHGVRVEVWKAEFRQYDAEQHDRITAEEFAALLARQVLGSHLPFHLVGNIRRLHGSGDVVTLDMWLGLNEVMLNTDELAMNVEMFASSGMPVTKADFRRLMTIAGVPALPPSTIDIVFAVFDKDGDGTMEMEEFLSIMHKKVRYHYSVPPHERKSLPRRLVECSTAALADARH
ncbi:mitochondrial calcium uptake 1 [Novymonas esmeraldas]|uniref:Mitochondrial calcium uptake 1 n=1 Tax=Novymonas esmeraldas TaxID=1808958 RepID=A0AAW0EL35_9TRYP